jgi:hypothetical protein
VVETQTALAFGGGLDVWNARRVVGCACGRPIGVLGDGVMGRVDQRQPAVALTGRNEIPQKI